MSDREKGIEIRALRHQLLVLRRQVGKRAFADTDRAILAGLLHHLPMDKLRRAAVDPDLQAREVLDRTLIWNQSHLLHALPSSRISTTAIVRTEPYAKPLRSAHSPDQSTSQRRSDIWGYPTRPTRRNPPRVSTCRVTRPDDLSAPTVLALHASAAAERCGQRHRDIDVAPPTARPAATDRQATHHADRPRISGIASPPSPQAQAAAAAPDRLPGHGPEVAP
jgi:hypothetical protein